MAGIRQTSLTGFSGRKLEFIPPDRVRKYRGDASQERWNADLAKHRALFEIAKGTDLFKVPEIIDAESYSAVHGGYFDRRYVPGVTLERCLEDEKGKDAMGWSAWLVDTLNVLNASLGDTVDEKEALVYLDGLWSDRVKGIVPHSASDRHWLDRYQQNLAFIRSGPKPMLMVRTCHGDLAFDNILIGEDKTAWLIDPLTPVFNSCYWDAAKVLQSTYCNWRDIRRGIFRPAPAYMADFTTRIFCREEQHPVLYFLCAVLLRIIPYAKHHSQKMALLKWIVTVQEQM